jgi:DNA repair protein RadA/Sms
VIHAGARLKEAGKLGFSHAVLSQMQQINDEDKTAGVTPRLMSDVGALVAEIARSAPRRRQD